MKYTIAAAFAILLAMPAFAQAPSAKTYTLTVSAQDLAVIAQGLGEVPSRLANPVIAKLNEQITGQDKPADKPADAPKP